MTEQQGSTLPRFKAALTEQLQERAPYVVRYESPTDAEGIMGADGSGCGVWWLDDTNATINSQVLTGAAQWWDEEVTPSLVIQCVGVTTDDTQAVLDERATNLLGHALALLASDASLGLGTDADARIIRAMPQSWTFTTGVDSQNMRGARYELAILLEARVTVEAT